MSVQKLMYADSPKFADSNLPVPLTTGFLTNYGEDKVTVPVPTQKSYSYTARSATEQINPQWDIIVKCKNNIHLPK
jgi:hypothetical protein